MDMMEVWDTLGVFKNGDTNLLFQKLSPLAHRSLLSTSHRTKGEVTLTNHLFHPSQHPNYRMEEA